VTRTFLPNSFLQEITCFVKSVFGALYEYEDVRSMENSISRTSQHEITKIGDLLKHTWERTLLTANQTMRSCSRAKASSTSV